MTLLTTHFLKMSTHPFDQFKYKNAPAYLDAEVAHYNLKKADEYSRYGAIASQVDDAVADMYRESRLFSAAGWEGEEGGWVSPNGVSDFDWSTDHGLPLPIDLDWENYVFQKRTEAGWRIGDAGWYAPSGEHESQWTEALPEYNF